ncbi:site-specific DNA-methyltransferase (plasmid) [Providencia heimbachae]|uniref:site-specific DNA-methyltransferase n=1 Tax=Providencia heimbachae TaxID=333962 RepID=UPI0010BE9499|nr:site-specific DNA-methyltransferase [Providencia heimbachae]QCJ72242.1 site-specific DNA-methyltransferase [Providencia heimbachae]
MSHSEINQLEKITGNSPEAKSLDITQQNIEQLKQLFPEVFSENRIDFEALKGILGEAVDDSAERYNFTWNGKTKARQIAQTPSTGTLRPCKDESVNWDTTENLFIEGDNLEVLKLLQKSYHKKVKMIYIDPPYNTGKDFVYKDNFQDNIKNYLEQTGQVDTDGYKLSTNSDISGRYHSDWLNMIYPRLKLARNLLRDDGIIFISIDDNEYVNLKKVCDEIFGEDNFVGVVAWKNKYGAGAKTKGFIEVHEYILCYSKNPIDNIASKLSEEQAKSYNKKDEKFEKRGGYFTQPLMTTSMDDRPNLQYEIEYQGEIIKPQKQWVWAKERLLKAIKNNEVVFNKKSDGSYSVRHKVYLIDENGVRRKGKPLSLLNGPFNQEGTKEVEELIGGGIFSFPKPSALIEFFFGFDVNDKYDDEGIYLDFFSGSCSSAHAVWKLNLEDKGTRRYIMVQLPEPTDKTSEAYKAGYRKISQISRKRLYELSKKYVTTDSSLDFGFKSFSLDESSIRTWEVDFDNLEQMLQQATKSIKDGRSSEDVLYEIFLKYGYDLTTPVKTETVNGKIVHIVGAGALIVCLDDDITGEAVEGIAKLKEKLDPETTQVVFKDAGFADSNVKTNAIQILKQAGIDDVKSI